MIPRQLPRYNRGFFIVIADLVAPALLVTGVFIWFCKATRYMMINDAWPVVTNLKTKTSMKHGRVWLCCHEHDWKLEGASEEEDEI